MGTVNQSIAMSGNGNPQPIIRPGMIGYAQQPINMNWQQQSLRRRRSREVRRIEQGMLLREGCILRGLEWMEGITDSRFVEDSV